MKKTVIIADDVELNREILSDILCNDYRIVEAENGQEALDALEKKGDDVCVLLMDLMMPVMNGIEALTKMQADGWTKKIPILIISSESLASIEQQCLELGANDFIKKPFNPMIVQHRIRNSIELYQHQRELQKKVGEQSARLSEQAKRLREQNRDLIRKNNEIVEMMADMVESRDEMSGMHVKRVKNYTEVLARRMMETFPSYGLTDRKIKNIASASVLHDIGKIAIPDAVLLFPGKLSKEQFETVKQHTVIGCNILEQKPNLLESSLYTLGKQICRSHHEKWDGKGYPDGLKGNEIPLAAQLVAVADCFDALTTKRPYKDPFTTDKAYEMICRGECGAFNPDVLQCFTDCRTEFSRIATMLK